MGVSSSTAANLVVGAGNLLVDGADVGATSGDTAFRVVQERFVPGPDEINGITAPLEGTDFVISEMAELEFGLPEVTATILGILVPGSVSTVGATTAPGGAFTATTIAAAAVAGQSTGIKMTAVAGMVVGQYVALGSGPTQYRQLTRVGTLGAGGTGVDISDPLSAPLAALAPVTQATTDGATTFESGSNLNRRLPTSAFHDYEVRVQGLNGLRYVFGVRNAIMGEAAEFSLSNAGLMVPRARVEARIDGADLAASHWYLRRVPADA